MIVTGEVLLREEQVAAGQRHTCRPIGVSPDLLAVTANTSKVEFASKGLSPFYPLQSQASFVISMLNRGIVNDSLPN